MGTSEHGYQLGILPERQIDRRALATSYTVQISYANIPSLAGLTASAFEIAYFNTATSVWTEVSSVVDTTGKTVTAAGIETLAAL